MQIVTLLSPNQYTAQIYGDIRLSLALKGQPIPENDLWIAATVRQYGMTVLTGNAHFERIECIELKMFGE